MEPALRDMAKQIFGITNEDLDRVSPEIVGLWSRAADLFQHKLVAEVIDSKYCGAGIKPGQKMVFGPGVVINLAETDCPLCPRALGPLVGCYNTYLDHIARGLDPNDTIFKVAECLDPGLEWGGLGKVRFKVYAEKVAQA